MKKTFYRDEQHSWVKSVQFQELSAADLLSLAEKSRDMSSSTKKPTWVLDLDSTLFCVGPRIKNIFLEFLRQHPKPQEHWNRALSHLDPSTQRYNIRETFQNIFEQWGERENAYPKALDLWREFENFWTAGFFSNRFLHHDLPYPGAPDYVRKILERGFHVVYLTGRDRPRTGQGTYAALKAAGFPMDERTELVMKPREEQSDLAFKHAVGRDLRARFDVSVFIDNEPENLVMFAEEFPGALIVFFHTIMSHRIPERDFRRVLNGRPPYRLDSYLI